MDNVLRGKIDRWSDTNISDKDAKDFINNIKSDTLRGIVRNHFEHECYNGLYTLNDFKRDFKKYLKDKDRKHYFLPGLNDRYENILKMLLRLEEGDY